MTEEQIKQNAEEYADSIYDRKFQNSLWKDECYAYIVGAHSRDEEVEQLKNDYHDMFRALAYKVEQLRNPWISVEDKLPEIEDEKEERTGEVFVCIKDGVYLVAHYSYFYKAWYAFSDKDGCMYCKIRTLRYWMPIPQIEKGE